MNEKCTARVWSIVPCADLDGVNAEGIFEATSFAAIRAALDAVQFRTVMVASTRSLVSKRDGGMLLVSPGCEFTLTRMPDDSGVQRLLDEIVGTIRTMKEE